MFGRAFVAAFAVVAIAVAAPVAAGGLAYPSHTKKATRTVTSANALESAVVGELNTLRRRNGLAPLRFSSGLTAAANAHSTAMARRGFFAHESADGTPFWKRVKRYYPQGRFGYWSTGENLLWSSPNVDAAGAIRMWMNSAPHRKNMLTARWREIGISAVHVPVAPGVFNGLEVTIVTANFGVRR